MVREEIFLVFALPVAVVLTTVGVALTLGRRLARRSRLLALLISATAVPLLGIATTLVLDAPGTGDGPALALAGTLILAGMAMPITLLTSALVLRRLGSAPR